MSKLQLDGRSERVGKKLYEARVAGQSAIGGDRLVAQYRQGFNQLRGTKSDAFKNGAPHMGSCSVLAQSDPHPSCGPIPMGRGKSR